MPVDDSYPYRALSVRVCDGTYRDHNFAPNYAWMRGASDGGRMTYGANPSRQEFRRCAETYSVGGIESSDPGGMVRP